MSRTSTRCLCVALSLILVAAAPAPATDFTLRAPDDDVLAPPPLAAARDTTFLLGGPGRWDGKFETADGDSAWQGWQHDELASLGRDLPDDDPDQDNPSWQVNWLGYDPQPGQHLDSVVASPPIALPGAVEGLIYAFDVAINQDDLGRRMFYQWHVRSTAGSDPAELAGAEWRDRNFVYYGTVGYRRVEQSVADLLVPGARWLQVALRAIDYGWVFGYPDPTGEGAPYFDNVAVKAVVAPSSSVPDASVLSVSAAPNPFNPRTTIVLNLPRAGEASLRVFDLRGRLVRTLHEGSLTAGRHELVWQGDDDTGRALASGVYFYEAKAVGEARIGKLTLVR